MLIAAFFDGLQFHLQLVDIGIGFYIFDRLDLQFMIADNGNFKIIQVNHLIGVFNNRRRIGGQKITIICYTNYQRRAFSGCY